VTVNVTDDDSRALLISHAPSVSEPGTTDTYNVSLTVAPSGSDVSVELSETSDEFSISPQNLTFNTGNWSDGLPVTVTATDDDIDDGQQTGTIGHDASGGGYDGIDADVTVTVADDGDTKGISVSKTSAAATEGGATDTYTVVLDSQPTGDVLIAVQTDTGEATVDKPSLMFTPTNWASPQLVTVSAADDRVVDGETMDTITHTASGADYNTLTGPSVAVTVEDNDVAGVTITESGSSTLVAEAGTTDTYRVVLDAEPLADVTITAVPDAQITVSPASVTFTPENWNESKELTVSGVEDDIDEPDPQTGLIEHSVTSTDPHFDGLPVDDLEVSVIDADQLVVSIVGPGFGAPDVTSKFQAELVTGSGGSFTFDWEARRSGLVVATGNTVKFEFAPSDGGAYTISLTVTRDGNSDDASADFKVLGDVAGSVFVADILWLAEEGITLGCNPPDNDEFCPDDFVTRGQMAAFLVRFLDLTDDGGGNMFVDDDGSIFEDVIAKLAAAGITLGCNPPMNDEYCPHDNVTRGQMAAFLVRALGLTDDGGGNKFVDDDDSVFEDAIAKLAAADITRGCNPPANDMFCPDDPVTRGQMAAFIRRADMVLNP
jgi:hypothetical protein